ncbi:hypothetical protein ACSTHM_23610, partial [Vibrio parahaemolyticus]
MTSAVPANSQHGTIAFARIILCPPAVPAFCGTVRGKFRQIVTLQPAPRSSYIYDHGIEALPGAS